jgi:predicted permease
VTYSQGKSIGRQSLGFRKFDEFCRDIRYALRQLARAPLFTVMASMTLAIGVAANSTTFGLIDAIMFRPPAHVREPERVGTIANCNKYFQYQALRKEAKTIDVAAVVSTKTPYGRGANAEEIGVQLVTQEYFPLLGAGLIAGRNFAKSEDAQGNADFTAIISYEFWHRQFGGNFSALGQNLWISGRSFTIIGIAPKNFRGVFPLNMDIWLLLNQAPPLLLNKSALSDHSQANYFSTIARIHNGVPRSLVDAELAAICAQWSANSLSSFRFNPSYPNATRNVARLSGPLRIPIKSLLISLGGASLLVLMISCANVAGLLLIRSGERRHEIAIRMQLGAGRGRIAQQLFIETVLLTIFGGIASLIILTWTIPLMSRLFLSVEGVDILDYRMLTITSVIAMISILMIGIVPALQVRRSRAIDALKEWASVVSFRSKFRDGLLVAQIALALTLSIGAGLFVHSVWNIRNLDYGYNIEKVLLASPVYADNASFRQGGIPRSEIDELFGRMLQRIQRLDIVESAAIGIVTPGARMVTGEFPDTRSELIDFNPSFDAVTPGYFATLGTRILRGRAFNESDTTNGIPVAIVSESFAKKVWPGEDPMEKCMFLSHGGPCIRIVGVSETRRRFKIDQADQEWFIPWAQAPKDGERSDFFRPRVLYIRARKSPASIVSIIKSEMSFLPASMPLMKIVPMENIFDDQTRSWKLGANIFSLFGVMALILSGIGIYGALAFSVRQRTAEIGVRMAMGAKPADILGLVFRHGFVLAAIGLAIGIAASMALCRIIQNLLFGIQAMDSVSFLAASTIVLMVAGVACAVPALRAMRIDPAMALRRE